MALIEFLLKNWIFVIIALALFSQFRKASSRGDQSQRSGKSSMPTFGGNPGIPGSLAGKPINRPEAVKKQASGSGFNPPKPYPEGKERVSNPFSDADPASTQTEYLYQDAYAESATIDTLQTSKEQLAQGIIWAEILGPPRAKKPFRR